MSMKKILAIVFCLMMSVISIHAQNKKDEGTNYEVLKFMGIPMEAVASDFRKQLSKKGFKYSDFNKDISPGVSAYEGRFAGEDATVYVFYDEYRRDSVYKIKVIIDRISRPSLDNLYDSFKKMYQDKYAEDSILISDFEDREAMVINIPMIYNSGTIKMKIRDMFVYQIMMYRHEEYYNGGFVHKLHIDYINVVNRTEHDMKLKEDI